MIRRGTGGFWRRLAAIMAAYAVAMQSLLIAVGGSAVPSSADQASLGSALCLHQGGSGSHLPADVPNHPEWTCCILCVSDPHHSLIGTPFVIHRTSAHASSAYWSTEVGPTGRLPAHSIASARGPPPRA